MNVMVNGHTLTHSVPIIANVCIHIHMYMHNTYIILRICTINAYIYIIYIYFTCYTYIIFNVYIVCVFIDITLSSAECSNVHHCFSNLSILTTNHNHPRHIGGDTPSELEEEEGREWVHYRGSY